MNIKNQLLWMILIVVALTAVESSLLLKRSLLLPRRPEPCFTCRQEDRPYVYSLISFLGKVKDMLVRGLNALVDKSKHYKLDN